MPPPAETSPARHTGGELRERLRQTHLMLVFTPELCGKRDPLEALDAALEWIDVVQIRPKAPGAEVSSALEVHDWAVRAIDVIAARPALDVPVIVNDRVDVAIALADQGCAGVHLGQDDAAPGEARRLLGEDALIGLSTHDMRQVAGALEEPVDYLGFGPFAATATKGYEQGLGSERCWIANTASDLPLFPIGGIGPENIVELSAIRRAAVGSAILAAVDPAVAARELRELLMDASA